MSTATSFTVGDSVVVNGLVNREELNHRIGRVIGYDQDADRYSVKLWMTPGEQISVRIRPRNLHMCDPLKTDRPKSTAAGRPLALASSFFS